VVSVVVSRHGAEVLVPITQELPEPGAGEARVAVEAAGRSVVLVTDACRRVA